MKLLHLVLLRIGHYFQSNKFLFVLYIIGTAACSLTFIYFYGNGNPTYHNEGSYQDRSFNIIFSEGVSEEEMKSKMESILSRPVEEYFMRKKIARDRVAFQEETIAERMNSSVNIALYFGKDAEDTLEAGCAQNGMIGFYPAIGRTEFREGDGPQVVFLGAEFAGAASLHVDDILTIEENDFTVIGTTGSVYSHLFLPYESFQKLGGELSFCQMVLEGDLTWEESAQINQAILNAFPGAEVWAPDFYLQMRDESAVANQLLSALLYLVGLISFLFLIQYMLNRSSHEVVVFGLVGAKKRSLLLILVIENLLLTLLSAGLGMAVYFSLQKSVFLPFAVAPDFVYTAWDIVQILSAVLALSLLAALPFYVRYCSKTLAQMKTRYIL